MLCFDTIHISEGTDASKECIKRVHQKSAIFVTIDSFKS